MTAKLQEARHALVERFTKETSVQVHLSLDGGPIEELPESSKIPKSFPKQGSEHHASQISQTQQIWIWTGVGFLDHMLHALAKHAGWSLRIRTHGDLASKSAEIDSLPTNIQDAETQKRREASLIISGKSMTTIRLRTRSSALEQHLPKLWGIARALAALDMLSHP